MLSFNKDGLLPSEKNTPPRRQSHCFPPTLPPTSLGRAALDSVLPVQRARAPSPEREAARRESCTTLLKSGRTLALPESMPPTPSPMAPTIKSTRSGPCQPPPSEIELSGHVGF